MKAGVGRRKSCGPVEASARLAQAHAYLETARLISDEEDTPASRDFNHVAAGNAVLAAIAASDAICCGLLGVRARGQDHREAIDLLHQVRLGTGTEAARERRASSLSRALATALDLKGSP